MAPGELGSVVNRTTLGLNTLIQRSGAPTVLLMSEGFRDVPEIRRPHSTSSSELDLEEAR